MESTLAQYGLSGVIIWLMFKDIIKPLIAFRNGQSSSRDPEKPWNPWQVKVEGRVTRLEDSVVDIKESQKGHTEMLSKIDRTVLKMALKMEIDEDD